MRYIDSNVIAYSFYDCRQREKSQELLRHGGVTSTLNLVEAYNIIQFETGNPSYAANAIRTLLKSRLKITAVDINIIFEALKKAGRHKLKFMDLVHYTTAMISNCTEIASYDSDFDGLEIRRVEEPPKTENNHT